METVCTCGADVSVLGAALHGRRRGAAVRMYGLPPTPRRQRSAKKEQNRQKAFHKPFASFFRLAKARERSVRMLQIPHPDCSRIFIVKPAPLQATTALCL